MKLEVVAHLLPACRLLIVPVTHVRLLVRDRPAFGPANGLAAERVASEASAAGMEEQCRGMYCVGPDAARKKLHSRNLCRCRPGVRLGSRDVHLHPSLLCLLSPACRARERRALLLPRRPPGSREGTPEPGGQYR